MSMKNRVLLHRTGRDQYGNKGDAPLPSHVQSENAAKQMDGMRTLHARLNEGFIEEYGKQWRSLFDGMTKNKIWEFLYPHKKPSLGTFYNHSREYESLTDFLNYLLIQDKRWSLSILGHDREYINKALSPFHECGRYFVNYKGGKSFGTNI